MASHFCFDFVIAVKDHDAAVARYRALLQVEPVELDPRSLLSPSQRCTIFPLWNQGDRGMVLSLCSSSDPEDFFGTHLRTHGEGLVLFGIDVPDIAALQQSAAAVGVQFQTAEAVPYSLGKMLSAVSSTTNGIPFFFSEHTSGWWQKSLAGLPAS